MSDTTEKINWIIDLPFVKTVVVMQTVIYCVGVPLTIFYLNYNAIFVSYDIIKLLLICISLGAIYYSIVLSISVSVLFVILNRFGMKDREMFQNSAIIINSIIALDLLAWTISYLKSYELLDIKLKLLYLISSIILGCISFCLGYYHRVKREMKQNQKPSSVL